MKVTIAYFTSRIEPHFDWFCDSLANQMAPDDDIQVVVVDRHLWALTPEAGNRYFIRGDLMPFTDKTYHIASRKEKFTQAVRGRFRFIHLPPKPCMWQGPFRLTTKDWFCAATARNTAIIAAMHPYFVGVDDLSVLAPGWLNQVRHAAEGGYCVCGAYWKQKQLVVENGVIKSHEEFMAGRDTRWAHGSSGGIVDAAGSWLFGCSFGMPLELLLKVNGSDEICDGAGAEDYDLGIRVERAGGVFKYNLNMLTIESEEGHYLDPSLPRQKKVVSPDRLPAGYMGNPDSDHVMLWRVLNEARTTTIAQWTNLRHARAEFLASERVLIPYEPVFDWRDGEPLNLM